MNQERRKELSALVRGAKSGNKEDFKDIYDILNDKLFAYIRPRMPNRDDALDVTQEVFTELWKSLGKMNYRTESEFNGFVFKIAKRKIYRYYNHRTPTLSLDERLLKNSYEMENEDYRYLTAHMGKLPAGYQEVLRLRYWSDLKFTDIASILDINENTAKVWHHRAIKKLQEFLGEYEHTI